MALDREKTFQNAERLLKQGKVAQALDECRRLAEDAPKDLLMLNRLGDFLARSQRGPEAVAYYEMIVADFTASGFYPKAIAILKKIVKVDPNHVSAIVRLGELNLKQRLPGEARTWFVQAADAYLRARDFSKAREVCEKLAAAEPDNFVHVLRLAEATAAAGEPERAGLDLVALGGRMLSAGRFDEAQNTFHRACELLRDEPAPLLGLARCRAALGAGKEALELVDKAWALGKGPDTVIGEIFLLYESLGDAARSAKCLADPRSDAIPDEAIEQAFRAALSSGTADALWTRLQPLLERSMRGRRFDHAARLLERIARTDDAGNIRALTQLVEVRRAEGARAPTARAIERLIRAYQAKGQPEMAAAQLPTLKQFDPASPLLFLGRAPSGTAATSTEVPADAAYEAPPVPIAPADHEFVNGNLTEAEVFEKYGLHREALQQLQQILSRFPGHVLAQEKRVGFLRVQADRNVLRDGLVALALAKRAAGDSDGAKRAAGEAASIGGIERKSRATLEKFALVPPAAPPPVATAAASVATPPASSAPPKSAVRPPVDPEPITPAEEEELEILFDVDDDVETLPAAAASGDAVLEEIRFYLDQGMTQDALTRIAAARSSLGANAALDALEARARSVPQVPAEPDLLEDVSEVLDDPFARSDGRLDEDDLSSFSAALEAQFAEGAADPVPVPATPESEESVDEVLGTFKEHVRDAVDAGDFRTHYDLGIAYKEMGLLDDALAEFEIASGTPELYREACSMLGVCHWERGNGPEAIRWYRAALEAPGSDVVPLYGLRYDLANMLEASGDLRGAFELLSQVLAEQPGYRDTDVKLETLRGRLGL